MNQHRFKAEEKMLLQLLAKAIYSNEEIFLRELLSNASDAIDKRRLLSLTESSVEKGPQTIRVTCHADEKILEISDTGIGMTEEELVTHLGTIAHSGTREFLQAMSQDEQSASDLIGQFGIGFYSAFVVADKVTVVSRSPHAEQTSCWTSTGDGTFELGAVDAREEVGTTITLHLKESALDFLQPWRVRQVITKYSDHINWPIEMLQESAASGDESSEDASSEDESTPAWEQVNQAKALWTQPKSAITEEQYESMYAHVAHDPSKPLAWTHRRVEGRTDYTVLLYLPSQRPFDLWHQNYSRGLKLYVKRVFIMEDAEQLLPNYLRFVRGIVDTSSLPLNVSREILQQSATTEKIKGGCVKHILTLLKDMAEKKPEDYLKFWSLFGAVLKEGPAEDLKNKDKIVELLRFQSTQGDDLITLSDYLERMDKDQDKIYYITADSLIAAQSSPHLEHFRQTGQEVLLLTDRVDEWLMSHLNEYQGKTFQNITRVESKSSDNETSDGEDTDKQNKDHPLESVRAQIESVLSERVQAVRFSERLVESPVCLVVEGHAMSAHLQRILQEAGQDVPATKPILELNATHPLIQSLEAQQSDQAFENWAWLLFEQAQLVEGNDLENPAQFVKRMNDLMSNTVA